MNIRENNKYASESQSLVLSHGSRNDITPYFDFLAGHNKWGLGHMRKPIFEEIPMAEHQKLS